MKIQPIKPINHVANKQQSGAGKHNDKRKQEKHKPDLLPPTTLPQRRERKLYA
jgi:hypothetical protein